MKTERNKEPLDLAAFEAELLGMFEKRRLWVLATAAPDDTGLRVSARTMSIINDGLDLWMQASMYDQKSIQIAENPLVALVCDNIQLEGRAEIRGNAFEEQNVWFRNEYSRVHPDSFERWGNWPGETCLRVCLSRATIWRYINNAACRDYWQPGRAWREWY